MVVPYGCETVGEFFCCTNETSAPGRMRLFYLTNDLLHLSGIGNDLHGLDVRAGRDGISSNTIHAKAK